MLFWENMKLAFQAIRINKMRSFLTMLGMIIGISSVISIVSIGDTMRSVIAAEYENIGKKRVSVYINPEDGLYDDTCLFTKDDVEKLKDAFQDNIAYIGLGFYDRTNLQKGRKTIQVTIVGTAEKYTDVQKVEIIYGRMISDQDVKEGKKHIVIQDSTAMEMFGKENAVGEVVRAKISQEEQELLVVGIYKNTDSALMKLLSGGSLATAYIPETVGIRQNDTLWSLDMYVSDNADMETFRSQFVGALSRMKNKAKEEIEFYTAMEDMQTVDGMMSKLSLAVGAIAAISLVVGGIGIMNIMLVSVTERTREIGIRKALGARTGDVLMQFLIESAIISAAGGIIGTALGIGVVGIGGATIGIGVVVRPSVVITAVVFSAIVGIFFGLYPARKAAKADPITALRYE
ncbi:MAG: FtsX-like permease family protein [Epulopiscium sp.]|nr:FtsX-like permease family protein [Candidatus Epulonipiscium sp.]